jgi:general secretion pathway protein D
VAGKSIRVAGLLLAFVGLIASCSTYRYSRQANDAIKTENYDAAVYYYLEALAADPGNLKFKMDLQRVRVKASQQHFDRGMGFRQSGSLLRAESELQMAVQLDPANQYAEVELTKVRKELAVLTQENGPAKLAAMKKAAAEMKVKPPILNPASNEPMSLSFPNPTSVRDIYRAIGQAFGINILFDPKMRDMKLSIELKNVTARQALEAVMQAAGEFYKVLDEKTVIVVEDTPQNRRDYEDLVVKTFFLSNADVKDINNMLRALIDARRIATNEQLNSVVIRDTADKVAIAERLIEANDKAKAEVLIDVELIQVDSTKLRDIGMSLSTYSYVLGVDATKLGASTATGAVPITSIPDITRSMWNMVLPTVTVNLIKSAGEAQALAQPQLRITEGQKGSLVIADQEPIPTTTFNSSQTIGGNIVPITAFQYKDVGIKIEIEPRVHHNNEVTLKLKVEASDKTGEVTYSGQTMPTFGTRNVDTVIRLKEGETSMLAGLIRMRTTDSESGLPFLSDLPILGALFRDNHHETARSDLVLTLTPHIVRNPDITEEDLAPLWVGTENRITVFGNSPQVRSAASGNPLAGIPAPPPGMGMALPEESTPPETPESGTEQQQIQTPRIVVPRRSLPQPGQPLPEPTPQPNEPEGSASAQDVSGTTTANAQTAAVAAQNMSADAAALSATTTQATDTNGLATLTFYPARLPVVIGKEAELTAVLDPGAFGVSVPLNIAYDPTRLEVTRVEGGNLPGTNGTVSVDVNHTPALGWITARWSDTVVGSGTLVRMTVKPRSQGEIPVIFAGPIGAVVSKGGIVVALPAAPPGAVQ